MRISRAVSRCSPLVASEPPLWSIPEGLVFVTGLSGHGLTLGPVIGEIAADLVTTGTTSRPIHPFRLSRFREEVVAIPRKTI